MQATTIKYGELEGTNGKEWSARYNLPFKKKIANNIGYNILITSNVTGIILCIFHGAFFANGNKALYPLYRLGK